MVLLVSIGGAGQQNWRYAYGPDVTAVWGITRHHQPTRESGLERAFMRLPSRREAVNHGQEFQSCPRAPVLAERLVVWVVVPRHGMGL